MTERSVHTGPDSETHNAAAGEPPQRLKARL